MKGTTTMTFLRGCRGVMLWGGFSHLELYCIIVLGQWDPFWGLARWHTAKNPTTFGAHLRACLGRGFGAGLVLWGGLSPLELYCIGPVGPFLGLGEVAYGPKVTGRTY
jgi:hypothetical protein